MTNRPLRLALGLLAAIAAPPVLAAPAPAPKLIVAISVDQFSADLFAEYRGRFSAGLKRLQGGAVFPSGYQSHAATETCPGHSTILTGDRPARTGIIANNWFDQRVARPDKKLYCAEDPDAPGSSSDHYVPSARLLRVPTFGDRLKRQDPRTRVVAVAGKDRAAIMMGGHDTDQIWFWNGKSYATLTDHPRPAPKAVAVANARAADAIARPKPEPLPPVCRPLDEAVPVGPRQPGTPVVGKPGDERGFRASPAFDRSIAALAIALVHDLALGHGAGTDVLAVGLSATDYVGHAYGTEGAEMCTQLMALDRTVGDLLAALDRTRVPYAVVLTADHGGHDIPERNDRHAFADAHRVSPATAPAAIGRALARTLGLKGEPLLGDGPFGDMYLAADVPAALRPKALAEARRLFLAQPDVQAVFSPDDLRRVRPSGLPIDLWTLEEKFAASFDPDRSGDLVVALRPRVTPVPATASYIATHGSPWNYDRRVPILFWWPGMRGFEQPNPVETVDIMPSLAALAGLTLAPGDVDGRCLDLDAGAGTTCPAAP